MFLCALSCQKEYEPGSSENAQVIKIEQGFVNPTKSTMDVSGPAKEEVLFNIPVITPGGDTLSLVASISDMPEETCFQSAETKAAVVTTENIASKYGSFVSSVYRSGSLYTDDLGKTMENVSVSHSEAEGWTLVGAPYHWPSNENEVLTFCSYSPVNYSSVSNVAWNGTNQVTFSYANAPLGVGQDNACHDAENQKDILFAINAQSCADNGGVAKINFSHALTGVRFIKGDIQDCYLQGVKLANFKSEGTAVGTLNTGKDLDFVWTPSGTLKNFCQTFTGAVNVNTLADKASMDPTTDGNYTFLMVPQVLDASASVEITLNYGGSSYQNLSVNLGSITAEQAGTAANAEKLKDWSTYAGKIITIRINRADLAVAVDETFADGVKLNVGAKNTGGKTEFVRAAIVANWVDADGNICETCDFVNGTYNLVEYLKPGCNWTLNTADGFYYYSKAIVPGAVTIGKIFTSYTAPAAPEDGLHLEMAVIVQGVEYDSACAKAMAAWGISSGFITSEIEVTESGE